MDVEEPRSVCLSPCKPGMWKPKEPQKTPLKQKISPKKGKKPTTLR
jgi:hypothetical protein